MKPIRLVIFGVFYFIFWRRTTWLFGRLETSIFKRGGCATGSNSLLANVAIIYFPSISKRPAPGMVMWFHSSSCIMTNLSNPKLITDLVGNGIRCSSPYIIVFSIYAIKSQLSRSPDFTWLAADPKGIEVQGLLNEYITHGFRIEPTKLPRKLTDITSGVSAALQYQEPRWVISPHPRHLSIRRWTNLKSSLTSMFRLM